MKIQIHNAHVIAWCQHHAVTNWDTHKFYKLGALPGMGLDSYMQQVFPGSGSCEEIAEYYGWLTYMAKLALDAEKKAAESQIPSYYTEAIINPRETQKKRLGVA